MELTLNCHRCGGVMAYEKFHGPHEHFWGWRCIYCGEIVDEVILENRNWTKKRKEQERSGKPEAVKANQKRE